MRSLSLSLGMSHDSHPVVSTDHGDDALVAEAMSAAGRMDHGANQSLVFEFYM
jgi:hypothetical protein